MVTVDFNLETRHIFCAFVGDTLFSVFTSPPPLVIDEGVFPDTTRHVYRYGNFAVFGSSLQPVLEETTHDVISEVNRGQILGSIGDVMWYTFTVRLHHESFVDVPVDSAAVHAERQIPFCRAGIVLQRVGVVSSYRHTESRYRRYSPEEYPACYTLWPMHSPYVEQQVFEEENIFSPPVSTYQMLTNINGVVAREARDLLILETAAPGTAPSNSRIFAAANMLGDGAYVVESPAVFTYPALTYRAANGVSVVDDANASAVFFGINVADTTPP